MTIRVEYTASAAKEIELLSPPIQTRVYAKTLALAENPLPPGALKLAGEYRGHRIRVGDWRVFYTFDSQARIVTVYAVRHRGEAYR